jgi:hypothetical protein
VLEGKAVLSLYVVCIGAFDDMAGEQHRFQYQRIASMNVYLRNKSGLVYREPEGRVQCSAVQCSAVQCSVVVIASLHVNEYRALSGLRCISVIPHHRENADCCSDGRQKQVSAVGLAPSTWLDGSSPASPRQVRSENGPSSAMPQNEKETIVFDESPGKNVP